MDGMVDMAIKFVELLLLVVSLLKELLALALESEPELNEALQLLWRGLIGGSSWMGYLAYSLYAVGLDYNFAQEVCDVYGYLYLVIDEMSVMVTFAQPALADLGIGGGDTSGEGASPDALAAAAAAALAASGAGKEAAAEGEEAAAGEGEAATDAKE